MRVANSSLLAYGPEFGDNFSCLANCSGKVRSLIEYLHPVVRRWIIPYEIFVSARLMYLIFWHLVIRAPICSSLAYSLAKLIATNVGVIWLHIIAMAS